MGLLGQELEIYNEQNLGNVEWSNVTTVNQPLTWYKTYFDAPEGSEPLAFNLTTMSKGEAWVNGQSIGRYWVSFLTANGNPSQTLYHVPRSFLQASGNLLVLLEEVGGDPLHVSLCTLSVSTLNNTSSHFRLPS